MEIQQFLLHNKQVLFRLAALVIVSWLAASLFVPFLGPLALAGIFAMALAPYVEGLRRKVPLARKLAPAIVFLTFLCGLILPLGVFVSKVYNYVKEATQTSGLQQAVGQLDKVKTLLLEKVQSILESTHLPVPADLKTTLEAGVSKISTAVFTFLSEAVAHIPQGLFLTFIFLLGLYFFLSRAQKIRSVVLNSRLMQAREAQSFIRILHRASYTSVFVSLMIGGIQGLFVATGAAVFHAGDFVIVLIVTFILSFIPIIGAAPVGFLLSAIQFIQGDKGAGFGMLAVAVLAGVIDNILRPYFVSNSEESGIHPILALIGILGAIELFGFIGLFLGPVIMDVGFSFYKEQSLRRNGNALDAHHSMTRIKLIQQTQSHSISEQTL